MNPNATNPLHQPETEFHGELQVFSGPALAPDDPSLEPRVRKGRPADANNPSASDRDEAAAQE
jgi:hypothetical protein